MELRQFGSNYDSMSQEKKVPKKRTLKAPGLRGEAGRSSKRNEPMSEVTRNL